MPGSTGAGSWRARLDLPTYSVADAARYAGVHPNTVRSWFSGGGRLGPVLFREQQGLLSFLDLVEVAFVATFRKHGVSMPTVRRARKYLAETFRSEHPFAVHRLKTDGHHVLMDFEDIAVADRRILVADMHGQMAWHRILSERLAEFEYDQDFVVKWMLCGRGSPVSIDMRVAFGNPAVRGVPTFAIGGRRRAGEAVRSICDDFGLEESDVLAALEFEGIAA